MVAHVGPSAIRSRIVLRSLLLLLPAAASSSASSSAVGASGSGAPSLTLDAVLGSGMVLPADNAQLWGTAPANAALTATVTPAAGGAAAPQNFAGHAAADGTWTLNVSKPASMTLYNISVTATAAPGGDSSATAGAVALTEVMFGAVIIWSARTRPLALPCLTQAWLRQGMARQGMACPA